MSVIISATGGGGGSGSLVIGTTPIVGGSPGDGLGIGVGNVLSNNPFRHLILSDTDFWVGPAGNDSNPGTFASPFLTVQHALSVSGSFDWNGFRCRIFCKDTSGTPYSGGNWIFPELLNHNPGIPPMIEGNQITPANCVVDLLTGGPFSVVFNGAGTIWQMTGGFHWIMNDGDLNYFSVFRFSVDSFTYFTGNHEWEVHSGVNTLPLLTVRFANVRCTSWDFQIPINVQISGTPLAGSIGGIFSVSDGVFEAFIATFTAPIDLTGGPFIEATSMDTRGILQLTGLANVTSLASIFIGCQVGLFLSSIADLPAGAYLDPGTSFTSSGPSGSGMFLPRIDTPASGSTLSMATWQTDEIIKLAAGIAVLTVNLPPLPGFAPANPAPVARISTDKAIALLTVATTDGSSIDYAPTALAAGDRFAWGYNGLDNTWYITAC